ncbi:hypothetical protein N0V86_003581 [Didymella sp. IMI 355093]|nr:hypothetical protein N0V86_003581 [Didymella sp. IMI 355093]
MVPSARNALIDELILQLEFVKQIGDAEIDALKVELDDTKTELKNTKKSFEVTESKFSDTRNLLRDQKCEDTTLSLRGLCLGRETEGLSGKVEQKELSQAEVAPLIKRELADGLAPQH